MARSEADRIEREIAEERASLKQNVRDLESRFSGDRIIGSAAQLLSGTDSDLVRGASRTIRRHPVATAAVGAGLAWLVYEIASRNAADEEVEVIDDRDRISPVRASYDTRDHATAPGFRHGTASQNFDDRLAAADARIRQHAQADPWGVRADASTDEEGVNGLLKAAQDLASDLASRSGEAWSTAQETAVRQARWARLRASDLRDRLTDGTEGLSDEARARIVAARLKAYEAQKRAEALAHRGSREAKGFFRDHPLAAGAIAAAAGAFLAAALPRTRHEARHLMEARHALLDAAEQVYHEEKTRAREALNAGAEEAGRVARRYKDKVTGERATAPDAAASVERVGEAVRKGAKH